MIENGVPARHDQADGRHLRMPLEEVGFENHRVNMTFEMIHCDERLAEREGENFAVGHTNEERTPYTWAWGDGHGVEVAERDLRLVESFAHDWHNFAEMLARGEFGHHAAVLAMK